MPHLAWLSLLVVEGPHRLLLARQVCAEALAVTHPLLDLAKVGLTDHAGAEGMAEVVEAELAGAGKRPRRASPSRSQPVFGRAFSEVARHLPPAVGPSEADPALQLYVSDESALTKSGYLRAF